MGMMKNTAGLLLVAFASGTALPALAQYATEQSPTPATRTSPARNANTVHLAYIVTSSAAINGESRTGLSTLSEHVGNKTVVTPSTVIGLNIESDDIALYPFIYWPVLPDAPALSEKAQRKVQTYINAGGLVVFDTGYAGSNPTQALSRVLGNVVIKPLVPMDKNHTLTKSFYLVSDLKGNRQGPVWVEAPGTKGTDNVSSVIIGEKMWARSWVNLTGYQGKDPEKDQALRSGINMVIYALTGSYKEDQIHIPSILERIAK